MRTRAIELHPLAQEVRFTEGGGVTVIMCVNSSCAAHLKTI